MSLSSIDLISILVYFVALFLIGYLTSRKQKEEGFLIAERKLGSFGTMATVNASKTGSIMMTFTAFVFVWGIAAIWYFIGMVIGVLVFIPFAMRLKGISKQRYYTLADYFKYNYGRRVGAAVSLITIYMMFGFMVVNLIAGAKVFMFFTSWPFWLCAGIMVFVVVIYLIMGGFNAVARTDVIQYVAMVIILTLLVLTLFSGRLVPETNLNLFEADIPVMASFFVGGIIWMFAMPDMWQRVYSSKNKETLKRGFLFSAGVYAFFGLLLTLAALSTKALFPAVDPDLALIHGFANLLPVGFLGLSVVLLLSAIMSTIDTYIYTGASAIIQDFFNWNKKETVKNIRRVIVIITAMGTAFGILIQSLLLSSYIFAGFILILAVVVISTWIRSGIKPFTLFTGLLVGTISAMAFLVYSMVSGIGITPLVAFVGMISTFLGLIAGGIISHFKKP